MSDRSFMEMNISANFSQSNNDFFGKNGATCAHFEWIIEISVLFWWLDSVGGADASATRYQTPLEAASANVNKSAQNVSDMPSAAGQSLDGFGDMDISPNQLLDMYYDVPKPDTPPVCILL